MNEFELLALQNFAQTIDIDVYQYILYTVKTQFP